MSPRVIQIPMSGRDRRHYVQQLKMAEKEHALLAKRVPEAQLVADEYQMMADRLVCQEWSVRQFIGGDLEPSRQSKRLSGAATSYSTFIAHTACTPARSIYRK